MNPAHGQATGMAVTTFFGTIWWLAAQRFMPFKVAHLGLIFLGAALLGVAVVVRWLRAQGMEGAGAPEPDWHTFSIVANAEWIAILLAVIVLRVFRRPQYIIFVVAMIVGVHFLPLAPLFAEPLFYLPAFGMIAAAAAAFLPGEIDRRRAFTCAGCAVSLWLCAILIAVLKP